MARKERLTESGYYHVINRGVERRSVFLDEEDYHQFLDLMLVIAKEYNLIIHSYCLMSNHYHILLETKDNNISKAIQFLNDKYAKYFNKKYERVGHLWQGRFKSYYLFDDIHFWYVSKYIERNPLKANIVNKIENYVYQSYFQWKNNSKYYLLLKNSKILEMNLEDYEVFISSDIESEILEKIYDIQKSVKIDGKTKILNKRIETFFYIDPGI